MMGSVDANAERFVLAVKVMQADSVVRYREGDFNETAYNETEWKEYISLCREYREDSSVPTVKDLQNEEIVSKEGFAKSGFIMFKDNYEGDDSMICCRLWKGKNKIGTVLDSDRFKGCADHLQPVVSIYPGFLNLRLFDRLYEEKLVEVNENEMSDTDKIIEVLKTDGPKLVKELQAVTHYKSRESLRILLPQSLCRMIRESLMWIDVKENRDKKFHGIWMIWTKEMYFMKQKSAENVISIETADGPTSIFLAGKDRKDISLRQRIQRLRNRARRKRIMKSLNTMDQVAQYITNDLGYREIDKSDSQYQEEYGQMRASFLLQYQADLVGELSEAPQLESHDEEIRSGVNSVYGVGSAVYIGEAIEAFYKR